MNYKQIFDNLRRILDLFYPVEPDAIDALVREGVPKSYKRTQYVIRQDQEAAYLCFIFSGLYRMAYEADGREDTLCFITEYTPMASPRALYDGGKANLSVQTIIPGKGIEIPLEAWDRLRTEYPSLSRCFERMLVKQLYDLERRYIYFADSDIDSRYAMFMKVRPNFTNIIPLKYIAQYLGVTPETISRVRGRLKDNSAAPENS